MASNRKKNDTFLPLSSIYICSVSKVCNYYNLFMYVLNVRYKQQQKMLMAFELCLLYSSKYLKPTFQFGYREMNVIDILHKT